MKRNLVINSSLLILLALLITGCQPAVVEEVAISPTEEIVVVETEADPTLEPAPTSQPIVLRDGLGVEVVLEETAAKIISISPSTTEILYAIGAGDYVIGRDSNSINPPEAEAVQDLGGMWDGIPVEDILALEPDLVVMGENFSPDNAQQLRDLGLAVFWQANPMDFEGLYKNISDFAQMTGTAETADSLVVSLRDRVAAVAAAVENVDEMPLVFYELDATDPNNPWTAGSGTFISYVIGQAKGRNLGDVLEGAWAQISSEELIAQDPEIILLSDAIFGISVESVAGRPGWQNISAVSDGKVVPFDPNLLSVPGPRLVDGLEEIARIFHPDRFE